MVLYVTKALGKYQFASYMLYHVWELSLMMPALLNLKFAHGNIATTQALFILAECSFISHF